jgi:flagellar motor switch protein FliG
MIDFANDLGDGSPPERLSGPQRAAVLLMLLGEEHGRAIWAEFDEGEVRQVCLAMAQLGSIRSQTVLHLIDDFLQSVEGDVVVNGSVERTETLLSKVFPAERVMAIMADVKGRSGRQVWRRMSHVPPDILAAFMKDEYPQTIAVILSHITAEQGGRVLAILPDDLASDVVGRMLKLGDIRDEALENIEDMLHREFLAPGARKTRRDPYEIMADRFGAFDRPTEARFMAALEQQSEDAARRVREKMFTFEDLLKLDAAGIQTLLRQVDKDVLGRALKGASEPLKTLFTSNMSSRPPRICRTTWKRSARFA